MIMIGNNRVKILIGKEINDAKDVYIAPQMVGINRIYEPTPQPAQSSGTLILS